MAKIKCGKNHINDSSRLFVIEVFMALQIYTSIFHFNCNHIFVLMQTFSVL